MKSALGNIFKESKEVSRSMKVVKKLAGGTYEVIDQVGRIETASSNAAWPPGSMVIVQAGRIVEKSYATDRPIKTFEV